MSTPDNTDITSNAAGLDEVKARLAELATTRAQLAAAQNQIANLTGQNMALTKQLATEKAKPYAKAVLDRLTRERNILHEVVSSCAGCRTKVENHGHENVSQPEGTA